MRKVTHSNWLDSRRAACCNILVTHSGDSRTRVYCSRTSSLTWIIVAPVIVLLICTWLGGRRYLRSRRRPPPPPSRALSEQEGMQANGHGHKQAGGTGGAADEMASRLLPSARSLHNPDSADDGLARAHLDLMSREAREKRLTLTHRLGGLLGCQPDSCANQAAHLESLLLSKLGRSGDGPG